MMKHWLITLASLLLAACAPVAATAVSGSNGVISATEGAGNVSPTQKSTILKPVSLRDYGPAPELTNTVWRNTPDNAPLRLADLSGNVLAIDFWTFG